MNNEITTNVAIANKAWATDRIIPDSVKIVEYKMKTMAPLKPITIRVVTFDQNSSLYSEISLKWALIRFSFLFSEFSDIFPFNLTFNLFIFIIR